MGNKFYDPSAGRSAKVKALFDAIAPRYDWINDIQSFGLHRCWKRRLADLAQAKTGETALDLCCGTGDIACALARLGVRVVGLDFSAPMLERAARRAAAGAIMNPGSQVLPAPAIDRQDQWQPLKDEAPAWVRADAMRIPFPAQTFDIVTISYGLRNLPHFDAGLEEMRRVAKPGGRLLVLDFGKPDIRLWRAIYFAYLKAIVPLYGRVFCKSWAAYAYILESLRHYPAQQGVAELLRGIGCVNVRIINLLGGIMSIHYAERKN